MKAFVSDYEIVTPPTLEEALSLLKEFPGEWKPFAGGTDLMVLLDAGKLLPGKYINLQEYPELKVHEDYGDYITIGALMTFSEIKASPIIRKEFPLLGLAATEIGSLAIQNRATIGGNIVNASPAADSLPPLLVYEAEIELLSASGARWVPYKNFHTGYKQMGMFPYELLSRVRLRKPEKGGKQLYRKIGLRSAQAISKVCIAGLAYLDSAKTVTSFRLALGSVAPIPLRCVKTEEFVTGKTICRELIESAEQKLAEEISPIDDIRSTREYRIKVAQNLLSKFMEEW